MTSFLKVGEGLDVLPLQLALARNPKLFGKNAERTYADDSPHTGSTDVWLRYNDRKPFDNGKRPWSEFNESHESVWYPEADMLPEARPIIFGLMARFQGERLGGVLITKLAPYSNIEKHVDGGWHAKTYEKYYIAVKNPVGAVFGFDEGNIEARNGDVYWFRNDVEHWVTNQTAHERIAMICCIQHR